MASVSSVLVSAASSVLQALTLDGSGSASASASPPSTTASPTQTDGIVDVYEDNLLSELDRMMELVESYPYVSVDTEFPGVVVRPIGAFNTRNSSAFRYETIKSNVDMLSLIQLGLSFSDANNNKPPIHTFQFNLRFNISCDMYSQDSIDLLCTAGIQFDMLMQRGIPADVLAENLMVSGLVLNPDVHWISFHSGFDFAYLLRMLSAQALPNDRSEFCELLSCYFPKVLDLKYLMRSCESLHGGLQHLAEELQLMRKGNQHQAGSDALLTGDAFFAMREKFFDGSVDREKFYGILYGLH